MNTEQITEMFPTKNEQRIAQRVIETLKNCSDLNVLQISDLLSPHKSPSARFADCSGLYRILSDLHALRAIDCRVDPISAGFLAQDRFSLNGASSETLSLLYSLYKPKKQSLPVESGQPRFVLFLCSSCGAPIGTRGSVKSAVCPKCSQKNIVDDIQGPVLRTNDTAELQSAIKQATIQKLSHPDLNQKAQPKTMLS